MWVVTVVAIFFLNGTFFLSIMSRTWMMNITVASAEQQRSESPASTQSLKLENPETTKEMISKDGIAPKMMNKGGGKGGWLKAPLSEAQEPHGESESTTGNKKNKLSLICKSFSKLLF